MFEKFLASNAGDFRQRYRGTYGYCINKGKRTLVQIADVDLERRRVKFTDRSDQEYFLNCDADEDVGFEFLPPKAAWHNISRGAVLVRRIAQRQYQRGICNANTRIERYDGGSLGVSFATLSDIFERPVDVAKAWKGRSFALSPQLMVDWGSPDGDDGEGIVKVLDQVIGKSKREKGTHTITLEKDSLFRQEVLDGINRNKLEIQLK